MTIADLINQRPWILTVAVLFIAYIVIRDTIRFIYAYKEKKRKEKDLIDSEKRIHNLIKETNLNRQDLVEGLQKLRENIVDSQQMIQDKINEQQEEEEGN